MLVLATLPTYNLSHITHARTQYHPLYDHNISEPPSISIPFHFFPSPYCHGAVARSLAAVRSLPAFVLDSSYATHIICVVFLLVSYFVVAF